MHTRQARGESLAEIGLILALVAVVSLIGLNLVGSKVSSALSTLGGALGVAGLGGSPATIGQDSFTQAGSGLVALSTHTAETGGAWTPWWGTGSWNLNRTTGVATGAYVVGQESISRLGTITMGDGDIYATAAAGNYGFAGVAGRLVGSNSAYVAEYGADHLEDRFVIYRLTNGLKTVLGQISSYTPTPITCWVACRYRIHITGSSPTRIQARIWESSGAEPGTWSIDVTDATAANQTASGGVALYGRYLADAISGNVGDPSVDNFSSFGTP